MLGDGVPTGGPDAPDTATPSANNARLGAAAPAAAGHTICPGRASRPVPPAFIPGIPPDLAQFPRWRCSPGEKSADGPPGPAGARSARGDGGSVAGRPSAHRVRRAPRPGAAGVRAVPGSGRPRRRGVAGRGAAGAGGAADQVVPALPLRSYSVAQPMSVPPPVRSSRAARRQVPGRPGRACRPGAADGRPAARAGRALSTAGRGGCPPRPEKVPCAPRRSAGRPPRAWPARPGRRKPFSGPCRVHGPRDTGCGVPRRLRTRWRSRTPRGRCWAPGRGR